MSGYIRIVCRMHCHYTKNRYRRFEPKVPEQQKRRRDNLLSSGIHGDVNLMPFAPSGFVNFPLAFATNFESCTVDYNVQSTAFTCNFNGNFRGLERLQRDV